MDSLLCALAAVNTKCLTYVRNMNSPPSLATHFHENIHNHRLLAAHCPAQQKEVNANTVPTSQEYETENRGPRSQAGELEPVACPCVAHRNSVFQGTRATAREPRHGSAGGAAATPISLGLAPSLSALRNWNSHTWAVSTASRLERVNSLS